ncbi:MAG: hypothetical protein J5993_01470 [Clostridia bacterium]|nr:hypothetical protein [Clostridia bacterium]
MKVIDVIKTAMLLTEREDLANYLDEDLYDPACEKEISDFMECFRMAEEDIAIHFLALTAKEKVWTEDGIILYSALSKPVVDVLRVEVNGIGVPFVLYPDRIETKAENVDVVYSHLPSQKKIEDECEFLKRVPRSVAAYAVAEFYCLISGMREEAALFDEKYKKGMSAVCSVSPKKRMGARQWC